MTCTLALVGTLVWTAAAEAKTYEVTRLSDPAPGNCKPNDCSLREAVLAANERAGADRIVLPKAKRYRLTRANPGGVPEDLGAFGDLDISGDAVAISHPGKGRAKIDANDLDRVFDVFEDAPTRFAKLRIVGGSEQDGEGGGGVRAQAGATFVGSALIGNRSPSHGGGVASDFGERLVLIRSTVRGNEASLAAGGIDAIGGLVLRRSRVLGNVSGGFGGGLRIIPSLPVLIQQSTIAGNRAQGEGGGIGSFPNMGPAVPIKVVGSTVSGNSAAASGGGLFLDGPTVSITNSTIDGNRADDTGGGIQAEDGSEVTLNAVTVARNRALADAPPDVKLPSAGGGLHSTMTTLDFEVRNSLIALNTEGQAAAPSDCGYNNEEINSLGNNLISSQNFDCDSFFKPGDLLRANPKIGKLKRNGGPTKTVALRKGSPAIGKAHKPSAPNRDQRGRKRDNKPDIGAFERGA